jgi:molybdopterin-guanine dinucleotide biosynthesis protein A
MGEPLAQRLNEAVRGDVAEIIICCRRNAAFYNAYADRLVCDLQQGAGPVAGIRAILAAAETDFVAFMPVDTTIRPPSNWLRLLAKGAEKNPHGVFATDKGRHTACCLVRSQALLSLDGVLTAEHRSLEHFYRVAGLGSVSIEGIGRDWDSV